MEHDDALEGWLRALTVHGAADMFLVAGFPPAIRVNGIVTSLSEPPLEGGAIEAAVMPAMHTQALERYRTAGSADISLRRPELGRFRVNLHRERGRAAATIRRLPAKPPFLDELGLPAQVELVTRLHHGLVLVGGATGSGKTTTVAALVNEINRREARHIITIEDPIEYEHTHQQSVVEQVEIGIDAPDFPTALRAALRQAPDVIVDWRDARSRDDADCVDGGGDGSPGVFDAAHDRRRRRRSRGSPIRFRPSGSRRSGRIWRWRSARC